MLFSTLALTLALASPAQEQKPAPALDLLRAVPKDAWVVAQIRDLDGLRADLDKNAFGQIYQDQDSAGLRKWVEQAIDSGVGTAQDDPQKRVLEGLGSLHGSLALYVAAPAQGSDPDLVLLIDPGSPRAAFEKYFDEIVEHEGKTSVASAKSYSGVDLHVFEPKAAGAPKPGEKPAAARYCSVMLDSGTFAVITGSTELDRALELAHAAIDRLRGKDAAEGIAANAGLVEARAGAPQRARLELYADLAHILPVALADGAAKSENEKKMLDALGVPDMRWAYVCGDIGAGESAHFDLELGLPQKGMLRRLVETLGKLPRNAARAFPKESQGVSLYSIDVPGLWKWIWELVAVENPKASESARAQLAAAGAGLGGIDIEKDVIGQLTGEFGMNMIDVPGEEWLSANRLPAEDEDAPESEKKPDEPVHPVEAPKGASFGQAWWIGLRDGKAFASTIQSALDATGASEQVETEEFQGQSIWSLPLPGSAPLSFACGSKGLVLSNYPTALRAVLRMEGAESKDSVLEREAFKPAFAENGEAGIFSIMHSASMFKSMLGALELVSGRLLAGDTGAGGPEALLRSLPAATAIDKHFQGTTTSTCSLHAGVLRVRVAMR